MSKLVILGAAESGIGAALLGRRKGFEVLVSDSRTIADAYLQILQREHIEFEQGGHTFERVLAADLIVKSPGIPETAAVIQALRCYGQQRQNHYNEPYTPYFDHCRHQCRFGRQHRQ